MRSTDLLLCLCAHQARILAQIDESTALILQPAAVAQPPLARARWSMIRLLREYQLFKHTEIFDPVLRHGDAQQVARARRMRADCLTAGDRFAVYVARWSGQDIVAVWDDYRAAMLAMSDVLRTHIARERTGVEALLSQPVATRRAAPVMQAVSSPGRSPPAARADSHAR